MKRIFGLSVFTGISLVASVASAQDAEQEEFTPILGQRAEEARIYLPDAASTLSLGGSAGVRYKDNIYRAPTGAVGDFIGIVAPSFSLRTDTSPLKARLDGVVEIGRYATEDKNKYNDADLRGNLDYTLDDSSSVYADGRFRRDHVDIGALVDEPDLQALAPTTYRYGEAGGGWKLDSAEWIAKTDLRSFIINYDNEDRIDGSRLINDDRDYNQQMATARGGYKFWTDTALYLQGVVNQRNYDSRVDANATASRDSKGLEALVGVTTGKPKSDFFVDIGAGLLKQNYDALPDVSTPAFRALAEWHPAAVPNLRLRADAAREVREIALVSASGYVQSRGRVRGDYQLAPDWTVGGALRYSQNDFQVDPFSGRPGRIDHIWDGSAFVDYAFSKGYSIGAELYRIKRDSDQQRAQYEANVAMLRLNMRY